MSRSNTYIDISKGMNAVAQPHNLADGYCQEITNLYLHDDGSWRNICTVTEDLDYPSTLLSVGAVAMVKIYQWFPTMLPTDCISTFVYVVFFNDGTCNVIFKKSAGWYSEAVFTGVSQANVMGDSDNYQFSFVDGRDNSRARRIIITPEGDIVGTEVGMERPYGKAEFTGMLLSSEDDKGTAIAKGKVLFVLYTYVNEEEEESNPSPVVAFDRGQYLTKGYYTKDGVSSPFPIPDGEYTYGQDLHGSIVSFSLKIPITAERVKRVRLYVAEADYSEASVPITGYRLIADRINPAGTLTLTVNVGTGVSPVMASYENDTSPKGDDLAIVDGTTFIANTVNDIGFPLEPLNVWEISVLNQNKGNYANRWLRIDLHDATVHNLGSSQYLSGLDWDEADLRNFRIYDDDLTTPCKVFHYPLDAIVKLPQPVSAGVGVRASKTFGEESPVAGFSVTAVSYGAIGNDITVKTSQYIGTDIVNSPVVNLTDRLILMAKTAGLEKGIEIEEPGQYIDTLSLSINGNIITITPRTEFAAPHAITSTWADVKALLVTETGGGGDLESIFSSTITEGDDYSGAEVVEATEDVTYPYCGLTSAEISGDDITIYLAYWGYPGIVNDGFISTAKDVVDALSSNPDIVAKVTASILDIPGDGVVTPIPLATELEGGEGDTDEYVTDSEILTRFMAYIQVPKAEAFITKRLYLVQYTSPPDTPSGFSDIEYGAFRQLMPEPKPGEDPLTKTEVSLEEFYKDWVAHNPIYDETHFIATRESLSPLVRTLNDDRVTLLDVNRFKYVNAANSNFDYPSMTNQSIIDGTIPIFDERAFYLSPGSLINIEVPMYYGSAREYGGSILMGKSGTYYGFFKLVNTGTSGYNDIFKISFGDGYNRTMKVYPVWSGTDVGHWEISYTGWNEQWLSGLAVPGNIATGDTIFFCVSWDQLISSEYEGGGVIAINVALFTTTGYYRQAEHTIPRVIDTAYPFKLRVPQGEHGYTGLFLGKFMQDRYDILQLARFLSLYEVESMGALKEFALSNDEVTPAIMYVNTGVTMDVFSIEENKRPGRIQWGSYGTMPDLNEAVINEEIIRIAPLKSAMPTDEHNTILLLTQMNVYRMALLGDSAKTCAIVPELRGIGIINKNALCITRTGIAWISQEGLIILSGGSLTNVSRGLITFTTSAELVYDKVNNWIWVKETSTTYVFQVDKGVWWKHYLAVRPDKFIGVMTSTINAFACYADSKIYKRTSTATSATYASKVLTKAIALSKKLNRFTLMSNLFTGTCSVVLAFFGSKITGGTASSSSYTVTYNKKTAIPAASSDYVQMQITGADQITGVVAETENGVYRNG